MEHDVGEHEIEAAGGELRALGVLLAEVHAPPHRLRPQVAVAQHGGADVDGVHLGVGKGVDVDRARPADAAAHVEDALRLQVAGTAPCRYLRLVCPMPPRSGPPPGA